MLIFGLSTSHLLEENISKNLVYIVIIADPSLLLTSILTMTLL